MQRLPGGVVGRGWVILGAATLLAELVADLDRADVLAVPGRNAGLLQVGRAAPPCAAAPRHAPIDDGGSEEASRLGVCRRERHQPVAVVHPEAFGPHPRHQRLDVDPLGGVKLQDQAVVVTLGPAVGRPWGRSRWR